MPIFEIQGDDGTTFEVEAPTIEQAAAAVQAMGGGDKPWWQGAKEFLLGDNDPTTQNMGEKIGSALNKAGEAMTFGLIGDEASAAVESVLPGVNYDDRRDHYRRQEQVLERDNPGLAIGAELGGALTGALVPGYGAIGTLGRGAKLMPRVAASTAAGAGMGGTYGFMEGEGASDRMANAGTGAALGGAVGFAVPAIGAGVQRAADARAANKAIRSAVAGAPTTDDLLQEGAALYRQVDDAGVRLRPDSVRRALGDISDNLRAEGAGYTGAEKVLPASRSIMEAAGDVAEGSNSVPFKELDVFRRYVGAAAGKDLGNRADTRAATRALTQLDDFVANVTPDDVDAGDIEALQSALPKAREIWARMSRSQLLDDAMENAADYRTGETSGLRAQFQRILKSDKLRRGFSDAEIKMMRRVVNGTLPEQMLNYAGSGLGMVAQSAVGGMLGGIPGILAGTATGGAARKLSESAVRKNAEIARALVASGKVPQLPVASDVGRAITEALMRRTAAAIPQ